MRSKILKLVVALITGLAVIVIYHLVRNTLNEFNWIEYLSFALVAVAVFILLSVSDRKRKK